jgi:hypothetical protein
MDYTSLPEITETIISVIQTAVDANGSWPPTFEVSPELLRDQHTGLGFYLFHVQESSHFRNFPAPGNDNPPVNYTPMALNLFYQLSANSTNEASEEDAYDEQNLMGVAMKALHDHSIINVTTTGKKVNIKITLQTLSPSESVQYWAAAQSPVRLSAYYEVSVVFLEPEPTKSYAGRVLSYGTYIFVKGTPQITGSENIIEYTVPLDPEVKQVKISPAQAPPSTIIPAPVNSTIRFTGNSFGGGITELLLLNGRWNEPAVATAPWLVKVIGEDKLTANVQETAILQKSLTIVDILPGLYAAQIINTEVRTLPDLSTKEFRHSSNQFPFSVMPRIDSIAPLSGPGGTTFTVTGYLFQHADLATDDIEIYIRDVRITLDVGGLFSPGEYRITGPTVLEFRTPLLFSAGLAPVRIMINGVESPPNWITIL